MSIDQFATLMALTPEKRLLLLELIQEEKRNHADHLAAEVERLRAGIEQLCKTWNAVAAESIRDGRRDADESELSHGLAHQKVASQLSSLLEQPLPEPPKP